MHLYLTTIPFMQLVDKNLNLTGIGSKKKKKVCWFGKSFSNMGFFSLSTDRSLQRGYSGEARLALGYGGDIHNTGL